jgi:hypothetical protein
VFFVVIIDENEVFSIYGRTWESWQSWLADAGGAAYVKASSRALRAARNAPDASQDLRVHTVQCPSLSIDRLAGARP